MKYYLICYQQRYFNNANWKIANDATDKDPLTWLIDVQRKCDSECTTILLSAVEISKEVYEAQHEYL